MTGSLADIAAKMRSQGFRDPRVMPNGCPMSGKRLDRFRQPHPQHVCVNCPVLPEDLEGK